MDNENAAADLADEIVIAFTTQVSLSPEDAFKLNLVASKIILNFLSKDSSIQDVSA